ncbi:hypothetical protein PYW08_004251 [Mythimna loreyi]|uniref:Uncharacterized protein n=1 Tax=Mythimna loreyi TaxID=667449 RepID=A0ACC2QQL2_9NEOP|nr:hypothetical protein PYW08_004251 [Mythimna loreyi]
MAAIKTFFTLLLLVFAMVMIVVEAVHVPACDQFCEKADVDRATNKMAAIKTAFILLLVVFVITVEAVHVPACDQFCSGADVEKIKCCKAQGFYGYSDCINGQMQCYRRNFASVPVHSGAFIKLFDVQHSKNMKRLTY